MANSRFNSLQTGKRIQSTTLIVALVALVLSFNSLQTGKRIQSQTGVTAVSTEVVSIPFKRESVSKAFFVVAPVDVDAQICFNSLQTGKRIQSHNPKSRCQTTHLVSIPFKRESVSKVQPLTTTFPKSPVSIPFKRESVSKVRVSVIVKETKEVSIPFKRESVSKDCRLMLLATVVPSFNSLQTGKRIQSTQEMRMRFGRKSFNSLQTGKRIQSLMIGFLSLFAVTFQFPSNGKAYPKGQVLNQSCHIELEFQFPSNGKAYPKGMNGRYLIAVGGGGFNSLQTGKRIQSCPHDDRTSDNNSFNSLQTGKRIQRRRRRR